MLKITVNKKLYGFQAMQYQKEKKKRQKAKISVKGCTEV